jgi:tetratricopeptide (TPR) repeat protein
MAKRFSVRFIAIFALPAIAFPIGASLCPSFAQTSPFPQPTFNLRQNGVRIGPGVTIGPGVVLPPPLQPPAPLPTTQFPTPSIAAVSAPSGDVAQQAKTVTVLIRNDGASGSGVLIQRQGQIYTVLTAAHVVRSSVPYTVIAPNGEQHRVAISDIQAIAGVDLALVHFRSDRVYPVAKVGSSQSLTEGNPVYVAGFPLSTAAITQPVYNFTDGKVTARSSKPFADGYSMVYTNNTLPGMSGGGVFNRSGQLVGIHGRGDVDTKLESSAINSNIRVKTGFNLGIPIETFLRRAKELGIPIRIDIILSPTAPSNPVDDSVVAASLKAQQGDYLGAIAEIGLAIQQSPKSARLYFARANYYVASGQTAAALQDLDQTIALDPKSESAYVIRGSYRSANRDTVGAIADLTQAIKLNPKNIQAYTLRATLYVGQGDNAAAIADYTDMIRLEPKNAALAYSMRAGMYWQQGNQQGAITDMDRLIALSPTDLQAYDNRAHFRRYSGNIPGAIADYTAILKLNPRHIRAYQQRAGLKVETQDIGGAIADYGDMIQANPQDMNGYMERASLYLKQKQYREAITDYGKLIELQPYQSAWYIQRGSARAAVGDKAGASADFKKVAEFAQQKGDRTEYESWMKRSREVSQK